MKRAFALALVVFAGCFNVEERPCTFACGPNGACPDDYQCLGDGYCHLHGDPTSCGYSDLAVTDLPMSMEMATGDLSGPDGGPMDLPPALDLPFVDLASADLTQVDLSSADLTQVDLTPPPDLTPVDLIPPADMAQPSLSVSVTGIGTVTSTPAGISCPSGCTASFAPGGVQLDASGKFKSWGAGPCSGNGSTTPCNFTISSSQTQAAAFFAAGSFPATARATAPDVAALNPNSVTVEAFSVMASTSEPSANSHVKTVSKGDPFAGSATGYQLGYFWDGSNFFAEFAVSAGGSVFGCDGLSTQLAAGSGHFLLGEYDATSGAIAVYVDGTRVCTGTGTASTNITAASGSSLLFGAPSGDTNPFNGTIDEVRISNTLLVPVANATYTTVRHPAGGGSTVGLWHFDEGSGTTVGDSQGTNNATVGGTAFTFVAEP
jgi:hypothetical protein